MKGIVGMETYATTDCAVGAGREFDALAAAGALFVRLARREKRPLGAAWQTRATGDVEAVDAWLASGHNVGVLLGQASGMIDIEFDIDEGRQILEAAGIAAMVTPTWRSARGEHRLFRWEPWMPATAAMKAGGIELRIGGRAAQSVLPPSRHPTGTRYEWIVSPLEAEVAELPRALFERLHELRDAG